MIKHNFIQINCIIRIITAYGEDGGDDFDDKFEADSDIGEDNDDDIPDSRAWGSKRRNFYSTDFVDTDYDAYSTREQELAEQEETEARAIQQRLAKQLEESDFALDIFGEEDTPKAAEQAKEADEIVLRKDLSALSARQRDHLFQKDSPEFHGLIGDFRKHLAESADLLDPILKHFGGQEASGHPLLRLAAHRNQLILNYCSNISFYLVLKAQRTPIKHHPIVRRLFKFRQLLLQMEEKFEATVRPQLEQLVEAIRSGKEFTIDVAEAAAASKTKKLRFLDTLHADEKVAAKASKKLAAADDEDMELEQKLAMLASESEDGDGADGDGQEENGDDADERRHITYQIAKNKGLTPYRRKELRNPRVKNKNKYRKAVIRRKGQVRQVYKQTKRYESEKFGINARVKKGIKIQ